MEFQGRFLPNTFSRWFPVRWAAIRTGSFHRRTCVPAAEREKRGHLWTGRYGELIAESWCRRAGWRILRKNWKMGRGGEIDLVCRDGGFLVFAEVKTRSSAEHGNPGRAVNRRKRELIRAGAREWLRRLHRDDIPYRFDVIEIVLSDGCLPAVTHIPFAFGVQERR